MRHRQPGNEAGMQLMAIKARKKTPAAAVSDERRSCRTQQQSIAV
jgi:hypothetical protein